MDKYAVESLAQAALKAPGIDKDDALMEMATKPTAVRQIGYALLGVGCVVLVVAFLGCCGAAKEWRPLLCCVSILYHYFIFFYCKVNKNLSSNKGGERILLFYFTITILVCYLVNGDSSDRNNRSHLCRNALSHGKNYITFTTITISIIIFTF